MVFDVNTNDLVEVIQNNQVCLVFNLVETINESGRFCFVAPAILELLKVPFTGSGSEAIYLTTDKIICKTVLSYNNIKTPTRTFHVGVFN